MKKDEVLWNVNDQPKFAFLVAKGIFKFIGCPEENLDALNSGALIGDMNALLNNTKLTTSVKALVDGIIYSIEKNDLKNFLSKNPGLYLNFAELKHFE